MPIGPCLPPHLQKIKDEEALIEHSEEILIEEEETAVSGPVLPAYLHHKDIPPIESESDDDFGPVLPPAPTKGPSMPPVDYQEGYEDEDDEIVGPAIPSSMVGPMPPSRGSQISEEDQIQLQFQNRSEKMKRKLAGLDDDKPLQREEWMLELPSIRTGNAIVGASTFRKHEIAASTMGRSEWTKTPGQNGPSKKEIAEDDRKRIAAFAEYQKNLKMDKELQKVKSQSKRSGESMLSTHMKKQKKLEREERKKAGGKKERVAFNRETDMQGNILSDAQKKAMLKKTMGLGGRFSAGAGKFL